MSATPDKTILYVEDEVANWEVVELRLGKRFNLLWAQTAEEACTIVRRHNGIFHSILMDIQLKGSPLDGIALTTLFRGSPVPNAPAWATGLPAVSCPIFFVTAFNAVHPKDQLLAAGGDDLVTKPVDFLKLSNLLANIHMKRAMQTLAGNPK